MPSPFPGMDPYLEQPYCWQNFHVRFNTTAADRLFEQLEPHYFVKVEERIYLHDEDGAPEELRHRGGDVTVVPGTSPDTRSATAVLTVEPVQILLPAPTTERVRHLGIYDRRDRRLVTVIELLSPNVKSASRDRETYLEKRRELLDSDTHLVEIDFLRVGRRMPGIPRDDFAYCVMVSQASERPHAKCWPIRLRSPLPNIPVPLLGESPPADLNLKSIVDHVYDVSGYRHYAYNEPPEPPLSPEDAAWADTILASR